MTARRISIRLACADDAAAIAPLFDAYRRVYEPAAGHRLSRLQPPHRERRPPEGRPR